mmetsp:Transcript_5035/g.6950  ORF Transcript_5035/g.6950 Transcript_5035/m.6950 type:complete len:97 (-) Transcript_5035:234-524(-)
MFADLTAVTTEVIKCSLQLHCSSSLILTASAKVFAGNCSALVSENKLYVTTADADSLFIFCFHTICYFSKLLQSFKSHRKVQGYYERNQSNYASSH